LLLYSSYLPLGVPNGTVIYINTAATSTHAAEMRAGRTEAAIDSDMTEI
jgi:hypothetical protein